MFDEEMWHFQRITFERFDACLRDLGEKMTLTKIEQLFIGIAKRQENNINNWQDFMLIMAHIKNKKLHPALIEGAEFLVDGYKYMRGIFVMNDI